MSTKYLVAALVCGLGSGVSAATLTFDGNICGGPACADGAEIDQSYGDMTGVDVVWDSQSNTVGDQSFLFWTSEYSDLSNIAFGNAGSNSLLTFRALPGYSVTLDSFDLGAWRFDRSTSVIIREIGSAVDLLNTGVITIAHLAHTTLSGGWTSTKGIEVLFGTDFYNVGIDNITYSTARTGVGPSPIPLPAPLALLGGALAGLALLRRRPAA